MSMKLNLVPTVKPRTMSPRDCAAIILKDLSYVQYIVGWALAPNLIVHSQNMVYR